MKNFAFSRQLIFFITVVGLLSGSLGSPIGHFLGKKFQIELECAGCSVILEVSRKVVQLYITGPQAAKSNSWMYFGFTSRKSQQKIGNRFCPADILLFRFVGQVPRVQDLYCSKSTDSKDFRIMNDSSAGGNNDWIISGQKTSEEGWSVTLSRNLKTRDSDKLDFSFHDGLPNYLIHTVTQEEILDAARLVNFRKSELNKPEYDDEDEDSDPHESL